MYLAEHTLNTLNSSGYGHVPHLLNQSQISQLFIKIKSKPLFLHKSWWINADNRHLQCAVQIIPEFCNIYFLPDLGWRVSILFSYIPEFTMSSRLRPNIDPGLPMNFYSQCYSSQCYDTRYMNNMLTSGMIVFPQNNCPCQWTMLFCI